MLPVMMTDLKDHRRLTIPRGRYKLSPLTGNEEGSMVHRVYGPRSKTFTNFINTPLDSTPLHSLPSVGVMLMGLTVVVAVVVWQYDGPFNR